MNKLKFISFIALSLLLSNLILAYFLLQRPKPPRDQGPKKVVVERLHFDANQVKLYDVLIKKHQNDIIETEREIIALKQVLYQSLSKNIDVKIKDSLINELGKVQIKVENTHYHHFSEIKKICNEKQLADYDSLTYDIAKIFAKPRLQLRNKN